MIVSVLIPAKVLPAQVATPDAESIASVSVALNLAGVSKFSLASATKDVVNPGTEPNGWKTDLTSLAPYTLMVWIDLVKVGSAFNETSSSCMKDPEV